jgi:hypothetical protein
MLVRARREVRQAVIRGSEIVACTLSSAGGELLSLSKGSLGFQAVIIDEVFLHPSLHPHQTTTPHPTPPPPPHIPILPHHRERPPRTRGKQQGKSNRMEKSESSPIYRHDRDNFRQPKTWTLRDG